MKKKFALICACLGFFLLTKAQAPSATEIMNDAYKMAKKENKNIIVMFHASWCGWCHKMDRSMTDLSCKKFFDDNYITVHMVVDESSQMKDKENPGADEFRKKYGGEGQGIPYWLVFDKSGKFLTDSKIRKEGEGVDDGQNSGCPASAEEVAYFIQVLKKTSSLKEDQLGIIEKRFRMNEQH